MWAMALIGVWINMPLRFLLPIPIPVNLLLVIAYNLSVLLAGTLLDIIDVAAVYNSLVSHQYDNEMQRGTKKVKRLVLEHKGTRKQVKNTPVLEQEGSEGPLGEAHLTWSELIYLSQKRCTTTKLMDQVGLTAKITVEVEMK